MGELFALLLATVVSSALLDRAAAIPIVGNAFSLISGGTAVAGGDASGSLLAQAHGQSQTLPGGGFALGYGLGVGEKGLAFGYSLGLKTMGIKRSQSSGFTADFDLPAGLGQMLGSFGRR